VRLVSALLSLNNLECFGRAHRRGAPIFAYQQFTINAVSPMLKSIRHLMPAQSQAVPKGVIKSRRNQSPQERGQSR